jgi:hypothetical protein
VLVDCGSGHTAVTFYGYTADATTGKGGVEQQHKTWLKHRDGGNLPLTDIIPGAAGGGFVGETLTQRLSEFIDCLQAVLVAAGGKMLQEHPPATFMIIGATGGMRSAIDDGRFDQQQVETVRTAFTNAFQHSMQLIRFEVLTGSYMLLRAHFSLWF